MYGCESWTVKKAECQIIDAFELWYWRRLLRVPWTARRSNQSILKEISRGISLEGMLLKLKLQYFGHLVRRVDSLEKTLMLGWIAGKRRRGWMASLTRWMWVWVNSGSWWWTGRPGMLRFMGLQRVGHDWVTDLIWSDLNGQIVYIVWMCSTKGLFILWMQWGGRVQGFNMLLKTMCTLEHMNCFWNFPLIVTDDDWPKLTETEASETTDKCGPLWNACYVLGWFVALWCCHGLLSGPELCVQW